MLIFHQAFFDGWDIGQRVCHICYVRSALTPFSLEGWHMSIWEYRRQLRFIIQDISEFRQHVLPMNRAIIDEYLGSSGFKRLGSLLRSVHPYIKSTFDRTLNEKIKPYLNDELARISKLLQSTSFEVDTPDNLVSVLGSDNIEQVRNLLYNRVCVKNSISS